MYNDDFKFVHRQESFNDLAVRELAKVRAQCICRLQFGRCTKSDCEGCELHNNYISTYNMFNSYDKSRFSSYVQSAYLIESSSPDKWRSLSGQLRGIFNVLVLMLTGFLILALTIMFVVSNIPESEPMKIKADTSTEIIETIRYVDSSMYDINKDGKVNCIDYAVMFKVVWDRRYDPDRCEIVRNKNVFTNFHHLFICIDGYIYVEPWTSDSYRYLMEDNWDNRYNPKYNIKGETNKWLKEIR